jgi:hypothetical protein
MILMVALAACWSTPAHADEIAIGLLSFDTFFAAGTDAFDLYNFSGPAGGLLGDPYPLDSLTFVGATLTLTSDAGVVSPPLNLGDIGPGGLFDLSGAPVVQVPGNENFASATFTADLAAPLTFSLSDGSTFDAASQISVSLLPSSGLDLAPDTDFAVIYAERSAVSPVPEPATGTLLATGMIGLFCFRRIGLARSR